MDTQRIAVVQYGDNWRVVRAEGGCGELLGYDDAVHLAERLARLASWRGRPVDVLVHRGTELREHLRFPGSPHVSG